MHQNVRHFNNLQKKASVPDGVIAAVRSRKAAPVYSVFSNLFSINIARAVISSQVLRPRRKPAWSMLRRASTVAGPGAFKQLATNT